MGKKPDATPAPASNSWITSNNYSLTVKRSESKFAFDLDVQDDKNNQYYLQVLGPKENDDILIKQVLQAIANRWPDYKWEFQADANGQITGVR
jgi:hypothetical protein